MNQIQLRESVSALRLRVVSHAHDGKGGRWSFSACRPHPSLSSLVNTYWEVQGSYDHVYEKILPTADVVVIFNLGPVATLCDPETYDSAEKYRRSFVSGLQEKFLVIATPEGSWNCGMRLTPLGASRLLGAPMYEVSNKVIDFEAVAGRVTGALFEELRNCASAAERFARIEAFLFWKLARSETPPAIDYAWRKIVESDGGVRILDLAQDVGWSRKHLREQFLSHIGMTPKSAARLVRFNAAIRRIGYQNRVEWAQVAQFCGYSDQAHFTRDFRDFAGDTPEAYLRARVPESEVGFMALDES